MTLKVFFNLNNSDLINFFHYLSVLGSWDGLGAFHTISHLWVLPRERGEETSVMQGAGSTPRASV